MTSRMRFALASPWIAGCVLMSVAAAAPERDGGRGDRAAVRPELPDRRPRLNTDWFGRGASPVARLIPPSEADRGPLRPDEREEIVRFVQQNWPQLARMLQQVKQHNPERFEERLQQLAPRIRHLRRIFEYDAALGRWVGNYVSNQRMIDQAARSLRRERIRDAAQPHARLRLRRLVAQNVDLEARILTRCIRDVQENRAAYVEADFARLMTSDRPLASFPPRVRELVRAIRDADDDPVRQVLAKELHQLIRRHMEGELTMWSDHLELIRSAPAAQVDGRMERLLDSPAPDGP